ncbi:serine/threonine protein phosphatase 1 [Paenibacillus anaericanus]|uniref:Serine/threonine protein phosphatase n=1 Tax=Paenibacillus anaericanus TaxID=170367 RepID=A0A433Y1K2_9BACL|nr:metallophosphoesterase family protein [Paenibacillus anaericanus]MDQ0089587.1 serine/threonine protein phosphatase 1 [Paenibacillus anaericanus]RUT41466.1 serine/threonine protein phosphatase [Paenibacillus anaericanus]
MRKLVISDIHGCYDEFTELLNKAKYKPSVDQLILLGDYCDRGLRSKEVIEQVIQLVEQGNVIALRGNHDQMFIDAMESNENAIWIENGGLSTLKSYVGTDWFKQGFNYPEYNKAKTFIKLYYQHHIDFLKSLPLYSEDDRHIFVHAGIDPTFSGDFRSQPDRSFLWGSEEFLDHANLLNKTIVFGHIPTKRIHNSAKIYFGDKKIGIDGGCCFGFQLNGLEIKGAGYKTYAVHKNKGVYARFLELLQKLLNLSKFK